jgi:hypothetical protein
MLANERAFVVPSPWGGGLGRGCLHESIGRHADTLSRPFGHPPPQGEGTSSESVENGA